MNTDITGIADLNKVQTAAIAYRDNLKKQCSFLLKTVGGKGMIGQGLNNSPGTAGVLKQYDTAISYRAKTIIAIMDKLINSIEQTKNTYNKSVTQAAGSTLTAATNKMKS